MTNMVFLTDGDYHHGTKCPETKLEIKERKMTERVKFVSISRTISDSSGIHYMDAIDENGIHWMAQMEIGVEKWITYKKIWYKDPQQPYDL